MPSTFVYVGNAESQSVTIFALSPDGALAAVDTQAVPGPAKPGSTTPMAVSPDKKFLIVGLRNEPYSAATFAIDLKTGTLSFVGSGPLADAMAYIATDRSGRFLLSASYGGGKIAVNPIGEDGVVKSAQQVIEGQPNAHAVIADRANRHVLYSSLGNDSCRPTAIRRRDRQAHAERSAGCERQAESRPAPFPLFPGRALRLSAVRA